MARAEEYRQRAKQAEENANKTSDPVTKESFLDLARRWQQLAEEAERGGW